jgi:hypothetical protein
VVLRHQRVDGAAAVGSAAVGEGERLRGWNAFHGAAMGGHLEALQSVGAGKRLRQAHSHAH